jgi:hypothetical protein
MTRVYPSAGALGGDELGGDLLSSTGLVTSSEEYYPTVAINALMKTLRDPALSSHHPQVVRSLFYIFQALQMQAVPYLPKVRAQKGSISAVIICPPTAICQSSQKSKDCLLRRILLVWPRGIISQCV